MSLTDDIKLVGPAEQSGSGSMVAEATMPLKIDVASEQDDRFHRFRLIRWWDQQKLARAKVLVIGAGALGNEILKNLALLGIGNVLVVDLDNVENSNLP